MLDLYVHPPVEARALQTWFEARLRTSFDCVTIAASGQLRPEREWMRIDADPAAHVEIYTRVGASQAETLWLLGELAQDLCCWVASPVLPQPTGAPLPGRIGVLSPEGRLARLGFDAGLQRPRWDGRRA